MVTQRETRSKATFSAKSKRKSTDTETNEGPRRGRPRKKAKQAEEQNDSGDEAYKGETMETVVAEKQMLEGYVEETFRLGCNLTVLANEMTITQMFYVPLYYEFIL
jgi:hypothetical protein